MILLIKGRVVHITTVHPPFDTRIFYKECRSLAKKGYEVYLVHTESSDYDEEKFKENNIKPIILKKQKSRIKRVFKGTKHALQEAIKLKAEIYHIHDPELLLITSKLKKTGAKVIYDMHEDYHTSIMQKEYIPSFFRTVLANLFTLYERKKAKKLEVILAEKYYENKFPNGVKILNYPIIGNLKERIAYSNNNKLLYTGNVTEDRGALIHAEIPAYTEKVEVNFVGKCTRRLADKMKLVCGEESAIRFKGIDEFVPREEIDKEYIEKNWLAGLAIFPPTEHYMKKELTKFFEYMYAGLPIIVSDFPEWRKFIERHQCGVVVEYDNKKKIKETVEYLKNNPEVAIEMATNGQKAVLKELNWGKESEKLIRFYETI